LRVKGKISPDQKLQVWIAYDNDDYQLVGTVVGSADYVDYGVSFALGTSLIGSSVIGGGFTTNVYGYLTEFKLQTRKFRKRSVRFVAIGLGYVSVDMIEDFDIWVFQDRMPSKYRIKQNVSLDGLLSDV